MVDYFKLCNTTNLIHKSISFCTLYLLVTVKVEYKVIMFFLQFNVVSIVIVTKRKFEGLLS